MQRQVRFNRVPEKAPEKNPEKVLGGFGAESGQVQQGSGDKACEALVQSQVRLNRAPEKVREKFPGSLGAKPSQVQRVPEKVAEKVPAVLEKVLGIFGPGQVQQVQQGFQRLASQHASERFVKIKRCGCWGYHRSLLFLKSKTLTCVAWPTARYSYILNITFEHQAAAMERENWQKQVTTMLYNAEALRVRY